MDGKIVRRVASECCAYLESVTGEKWSDAGVPGMDWNVAQVAAHISETVLWYATDLVAGDRELSTMEMRVRPESAPEDLVATLRTFASLLAHAVDGVGPDARGWHPDGLADASGFAGMACDEMLVHTADIGTGLGVPFQPSAELASATLRRLFPWAPAGGDAWETLLWANGRADLPGLERQVGWRWHCAPLSEWDGTNPRVVS
ncbi:MAG: hypothetical protein HOV86_18185 [Thermoactinospora sp.]|nr:hypothetical protein [Thermoactinospora sp.]